MDLTERSRRRVEDALARLEATRGVERVVEDRWRVDAAEYDRTVERFEAGTLGGAGAWVTDDAGRVLLVREADREGWSEPSGKHEPGETLAGTARRETREETGLVVDPGRVELAQVAEHVDRSAPERPPVVRLVAVFAASPTGGEARPAEDGVEAVRWFETHPDDLLYDALAELPLPASR